MNYKDFDALPDMLRDFAMDVANGTQQPAELAGAYDMLEDLGSAVRETQMCVNAALLEATSKEALIANGNLYKSKRVFTDRPQQDRIAHGVVTKLVELGMPEANAWKAWGLIVDLYVSPSTTPKATGLKRIDVPRKEAVEREFTKYKIEVFALQNEDNDE